MAAAEEELASRLQVAEVEILQIRELSDALQTIVDHKLERSALYQGEAPHPGTVTPPAQPTVYHTIVEGSLTVDSLRQSILAWCPTPASSSSESLPSSLVYGGMHLLRMLVLLPDIWAQIDFQPEQAALKSLSASLQKFLGVEAGQFLEASKYQ